MEAVASQHLRLNAVYWGLCCLELLGAPAETLDRPALRAWTLTCRVPPRAGGRGPGGGFAPAPGHDAHCLSTLSALQVLALLGDPLLADAAFCDSVAAYLAALQRPGEGWFAGDEAGSEAEVDTRFSFAALAGLALLRRPAACDAAAAHAFLRRCCNFDGGFGATPGGESHAGQAFTCLAALRLCAPSSSPPDGPRLAHWLAQRQCPGGGLNGRPEKAPDVCYSWWVLSSLALLGKAHWVDGSALAGFILSAQDGAKGGIADRGEDEADVYHTFFGVAGLSLLGYPGLAEVDPTLALPVATLRTLGLA